MWFGEPHPSPERSSPTRLSALGHASYKRAMVCNTCPRYFVLYEINWKIACGI